MRVAEPAAHPVVARVRTGKAWLLGFLVYGIACQLLLLVPALNSLRVPLRTAAFSGSLVLLLALPGRAMSKHPARAPLMIVGLLMIIAVVHPLGGGLLAAIAHVCIYIAIFGPLFWVTRLEVDERTFELLITLFWLYSTASAALGVLQVYFPGQFQPPLASVLAERGPIYIDSMQVQLASGTWVLRPMGLT